MNLKDVVIKLNALDIKQIIAADIDGDPEGALSFIRENLLKKVKKALEIQ